MSYLGSYYRCARFTLETTAPLSIATGNSNGVFDTGLVRDANGLPAIPGTTLAGVLRHLYWQEYEEDEMQELFGYQEKAKGKPSLLNVSWGAIQDSQGQAITGLCLGNKRRSIEKDSVLKIALASDETPIYRDRVRLNHRGSATKQGKFDRSVLPAGYRFSVELSRWSDEEEDIAWDNILKLLVHPMFRLGGSTRAGLGKVELKKLDTITLNLAIEQDREKFEKLSRDINNTQGFSNTSLPGFKQSDSNKVVTAELILEPKNYWRIGQGETGTLEQDGKPSDLLPKLEQKITWEHDDAEAQAEQLLIPASSVKGALSHRIAFHANRLDGMWADELIDETAECTEETFQYSKDADCDAVQALFGLLKDDDSAKGSKKGRVGNVLIDDAYITFSASDLQMLIHNSIDRFSGSVREHMLFTEEMVWRKKISINLAINNIDTIEGNTKQALSLALDDMCKGRLALGAGVSKGHGFCKGTIKWSDNGDWINQEEAGS